VDHTGCSWPQLVGEEEVKVAHYHSLVELLAHMTADCLYASGVEEVVVAGD
jgi:hypothetical protein